MLTFAEAALEAAARGGTARKCGNAGDGLGIGDGGGRRGGLGGGKHYRGLDGVLGGARRLTGTSTS